MLFSYLFFYSLPPCFQILWNPCVCPIYLTNEATHYWIHHSKRSKPLSLPAMPSTFYLIALPVEHISSLPCVLQNASFPQDVPQTFPAASLQWFRRHFEIIYIPLTEPLPKTHVSILWLPFVHPSLSSSCYFNAKCRGL